MITGVVMEREARLREGMRMMGMRSLASAGGGVLDGLRSFVVRFEKEQKQLPQMMI